MDKAAAAGSSKWFQFATWSWYALLFLQPFNQFGGLRSAFLVILLIVLAADLRQSSRDIFHGLWAHKFGLVVAIWAVFVSIIGPYPADSLNALRKDFLAQTVLFLAGLRLVREPKDVWRAIIAAIAGIAVITCLAWGEVVRFWLDNGLSSYVPRSHKSFYGGYGPTAAFFFPLLLGMLLAIQHRKAMRVMLGLLLMAMVILIVLYHSRTALLATLAATMLLLVMLRRWSSIVLMAVIVTGFLSMTQENGFQKYGTLLRGDTYVTNTGLSMRLSVWDGCLQVINERPAMGYGYGWKKLAWVINDRGFATRWEKEQPDVALYYLSNGKASYGRVNPHNYVLQVAFEIGWAGLVAVLLFWTAVIRDSKHLLGAKIQPSMTSSSYLAAVIYVTLFAYAVMNITNGYWVGNLANLSIAMTSCLLALARETTRQCR